MKTTWIVVGLLVLVLFLIGIRERYTTYEDALKDVGQTAGYVTPACPDGFTMSSDRKTCEKPKEDGTMETADPTCPSGSTFVKEGTQGHCEGSSAPAVSDSSSSSQASVPTESSASVASESSSSSQASVPTESSAPNVAARTGSGGPAGAPIVPQGARPVWGPVYRGSGQGPNAGGRDSTTTNAYPALLGGFGGRTPGVRTSESGLPFQTGAGLGAVMPSSSALGTDANSRFLPYSRQPGDMDLVPDPYRLATNFSTSSYSASKTDPVPFLTDFSAFYR